jgi:hypothetical protein
MLDLSLPRCFVFTEITDMHRHDNTWYKISDSSAQPDFNEGE